MIKLIFIIVLFHQAIQKAIFEYQSALIKGYSDFEKRDYVLLNTTDLSETVVQMVQDPHQINITSDYQQNYLKMEVKDFLFRVFSQRFYLYELVLDFSTDISVMTGWNILSQMQISKDGLNKLNSMSTPYKMWLKTVQVDKLFNGNSKMKCDRFEIHEVNTTSNVIIDLCNLVDQVDRDTLQYDGNIYDAVKQTKKQLRPDEY